MLSLPQRLFGTDEPVPAVRDLAAGTLSVQLQGHWLRHIRWSGHEVWHGLALVLRDVDWGTPEPRLDVLEVEQGVDTFDLTLQGQFPGPVAFRLTVHGSALGELDVDAEWRAGSDVALNRLGLCLLHPRSAQGARVEVTHVDGRTSCSTFPERIVPWPPFMLVRGLRHEWAAGRWATATLEGDLFETEDQRNNADATFKTYSRSNLAPRPYRVSAGMSLRQSARLRLDDPQPIQAPANTPLQVRLDATEATDWPALGLEIRPDDVRDPVAHSLLQELAPTLLHLAWRPGQAIDWAGLASLLDASGARLRLDVLLPADAPPQAGLLALRAALDAAGVNCACLAVFPSDPARVDAARQVFPDAAIGGGTPHFFVQLNRLDDLGPVDFATFTTASVVHGVQDEEMMLGLQSLPDMVRTWQEQHPSIPLRVGPSSLAARSSPLGAQPFSDGNRRLALAAVDPRVRGQFGAAWALGHVAGLALPGVASVSLLALSGPNGLTHQVQGRVQRHPAYHVIAALAPPARRLRLEVSHPDRVAAVALRRHDRTLLLLANLGGEAIEVDVCGMPAASVVQQLDATEWPDGQSPGWRAAGTLGTGQRLEPYGLALIEAPAPRPVPSGSPDGQPLPSHAA